MASLKKRIPITDFIVIGIILTITGFMFFRNKNSSFIDPNTLLSPDTVNEIVLNSIANTPLDTNFDSSKISGKIRLAYFSTVNRLSTQKIFSSILHFFNKNKGIVEDCSSCSTEASCGDSSQPVISYPIDLSLKALHVKSQQYPKLMIIDVRDTNNYVEYHIPSSINMPLLDLVNQMFIVDRWTEIVIVGNSYFQTKLAGESLLRLNFHRLHRLIVPVEKWDREFESFK